MLTLLHILGTILLTVYIGSIGAMFYLSYKMIKDLISLHNEVVKEEEGK